MVSILDYVSWDGRSGFIDAWKIKHFNAKGRKTGVCDDLLSGTRVVSSITLDMKALHFTSKASTERMAIPLSG
jgi:hypothetical protein